MCVKTMHYGKCRILCFGFLTFSILGDLQPGCLGFYVTDFHLLMTLLEPFQYSLMPFIFISHSGVDEIT